MRKTANFLISIFMSLVFLAGCNTMNKKTNGAESTSSDSGVQTTEAQEVGFSEGMVTGVHYQNAFAQFGSFPVLGDPYLYYDEQEKIFYLYGTTGGRQFDFYISEDLREWTLGGTCFKPTDADWCHSRLWAPEMHKIGEKYWLYYSAGENDSATLHCSVAVADSPAGPFTNDIAEGVTGSAPRFDFGFASIDGTVFEDDDGRLYYYFAKDQVNGVSTIWGVELENPYTIKRGATAVQLTRKGYADMTSNVTREWENSQGSWNEGPFMVKHDGVYYLTYSANAYTSKYYGVGYATSENPLDGFVKPEDSLILGTEKQQDQNKEWDYVSGTGHHMFVKLGGQDYIVYHKHYNIKEGGNVRIFTMDRYGFRADGSMYVNGSTISPQPLPKVLSGYENIASDATITCSGIDGESKKTLRDGSIGVYARNAYNTDVEFASGKTTITLRFEEPRTVRSVMLYAGTDYDKILKKVEKIEFDEVCYVRNIKLNGNYIDTQRRYMAIGNAIMATLYEDVTVRSIKITIDVDYDFSLSEIAVIGK